MNVELILNFKEDVFTNIFQFENNQWQKYGEKIIEQYSKITGVSYKKQQYTDLNLLQYEIFGSPKDFFNIEAQIKALASCNT